VCVYYNFIPKLYNIYDADCENLIASLIILVGVASLWCNFLTTYSGVIKPQCFRRKHRNTEDYYLQAYGWNRALGTGRIKAPE